MEKRKDFVMSNQSLNCYGFWTLTAGIDLTDFFKNPVGYYNHESEELPPLKWENIRIEGENLVGTAVFDEKDEFSMKLWQKVESGFINGASIGFRVLEVSEDPNLLKQGQRNATVTKCKLVECSVVNNPANSEALAIRLYGEKADVVLSGEKVNNVVPKLQANMNFDRLTTLGYKDADQILSEVSTLKSERDSLKTQLDELQAKQQKANEAQIKALCERKGLDKTETDAFMKLASADFESTVVVLESRPDYVPVSEQIAQSQKTTNHESLLGKLKANPEKDYNDWASTKEGVKFLEKLEAEHPKQFEELYNKTFSK